MRNQQWRDPQWRTRLCCVLAGAIFIASQFIVAGTPSSRPDDAAAMPAGSTHPSALAEADTSVIPLD